MILIRKPEHQALAVKTIRTRAGLYQRELAAKAGITAETVCAIERRKTGTTVTTLALIADALGYDLALIPREDA